jgi:LysR family transcriptional regulator, nitrogen assimilation regulatory protein
MDFLRSTISLRQLYYLVAVADAGSFSAAAEQVFIAQPALSRQISALESQVGMRLLHRSRKGATLTEGGVRLYNLARSILERLDCVQSELRDGETQPAGVVTVALPPSVASMLVPSVVRELQSHFPKIVLRVEDGVSRENVRSLEAALIDFGIIPAADELVDVAYEPLVRESLLLVERRDHSRHALATVTFDEVAKYRLVLPPRDFHTRRVIDEVAHTSHCTLDVAFEQRSVTTIMGLVREGLGATITNSPAIDQFWVPDTVTARRIICPEMTRVISMARPARRSLSFAAKTVYDIIKRLALDSVKNGRWLGTPLCCPAAVTRRAAHRQAALRAKGPAFGRRLARRPARTFRCTEVALPANEWTFSPPREPRRPCRRQPSIELSPVRRPSLPRSDPRLRCSTLRVQSAPGGSSPGCCRVAPQPGGTLARARAGSKPWSET